MPPVAVDASNQVLNQVTAEVAHWLIHAMPTCRGAEKGAVGNDRKAATQLAVRMQTRSKR